jgi:mono/diheme cytochrome c family protein
MQPTKSTLTASRWALLFAAAVTAPAAIPPERAVVNQYCVGCHSSKMKAGGLALDAVNADTVSQHTDVWEKVVRKLRARYMPPAGLPRPDEATYNAAVTSLEMSLDSAAAAKPNPGRTDTFRRLNRTEYQNSIRDLLAIEVDVASLLPSDESSHGFDNVTVGNLSPTLLERYLSAARKISRLAIGSPTRSPGGDTVTLPPDLTQEEHFDELPFGTRGGTVVHYTFPLDAVYEIQLRLARDRNEHVEGLTARHHVELMLDGERVRLFTVDPPASGMDHHLVEKDLHVRLPVKAGPHVVSVAFLKQTSALLETERQPYQAHFNMDRHPRLQPAVYSVSINGPYDAKGPGDTPSRRRIFVCQPAKPGEQEGCAKRILATLMRRAYRRPITDADLHVPMKFYQDARADGDFDAGIEMALRAVLVSPEFLFRVEQDPANVAPNSAYRISDLELATRLSFFLWSSIPDDELLEAAIRGKLKTPAVLEQQVRRMLSDARSRALVNNFAEQWLYLRNLSSMTPDMRLFPDFDDNLRQSFREETELFFESIMREDRSVLDLLRANYTFVNERLAKHYGIPNVYGSRFRRIEFGSASPQTEPRPSGSGLLEAQNRGGAQRTKDSVVQPLSGDPVRGGLLRQGSVLTVTSYATRTSPVLRGKWILANLLGAPPPPPPPFVPALKEHGAGGKVLTMRERMAEHRANPACSGCHQLMDPVGFALENYDAVGRWRTAEEGTPLDVTGGLPDGSKFEGVSGLQKALLSRPEIFLTTFTDKLLTYALGRGVEDYDAPAVRAIVREAGPQNFRFSSFIIGTVKSTPFQMRRTQ